MNDLDNPSASSYELGQLQGECDSLRRLVGTLLILLVIVSGTLSIFLFRQYTLIHQEVDGFRRQYEEASRRYQQIKPKMDDFERRVTDYARTHPDFAPIAATYGINTSTAAHPPTLPATKK